MPGGPTFSVTGRYRPLLGYARVLTRRPECGAPGRRVKRSGCSSFPCHGCSIRDQSSPSFQISCTRGTARRTATRSAWPFHPPPVRQAHQPPGRTHRIQVPAGDDRSDFSDGRLVFHVLAALAKSERDFITERTSAGLTATGLEAPARGRRASHATAPRSVRGCALEGASPAGCCRIFADEPLPDRAKAPASLVIEGKQGPR
jgi:hypothetical protein